MNDRGVFRSYKCHCLAVFHVVDPVRGLAPTDVRPQRTSTSSPPVSLPSLSGGDETLRPTKNKARHAQVLENNRTLLTYNIVWSSEFHERLSELAILPPTMLAEVKVGVSEVNITFYVPAELLQYRRSRCHLCVGFT